MCYIASWYNILVVNGVQCSVRPLGGVRYRRGAAAVGVPDELRHWLALRWAAAQDSQRQLWSQARQDCHVSTLPPHILYSPVVSLWYSALWIVATCIYVVPQRRAKRDDFFLSNRFCGTNCDVFFLSIRHPVALNWNFCKHVCQWAIDSSSIVMCAQFIARYGCMTLHACPLWIIVIGVNCEFSCPA